MDNDDHNDDHNERFRPSQLPHPVRNGIGGLAASMAALTVGVPVDVVSQRLQMDSRELVGRVVGGAESRGYGSSPFRVMADIWAHEGFTGFYRGTAATMLSSVPSSALWWATYTACKPLIMDGFHWQDSDPRVHMIGGVIAGIVAATATNPLDIIRTRLQIDVSSFGKNGGGKVRPSILSVASRLYAEEPLLSLWTKGLAPRLWTSALIGIVMVLAYEKIKVLSVRRVQHEQG